MKEIKQLFITYGLVKIVIFSFIIGSSFLLPYAKDKYESNFIFPQNEKHSIFSGLKAWDGMHYLYIAKNGYGKASISNRFFPLYPLTIVGIHVFVPDYLLSGLISSTIFSFFALLIFYLLTRELFDENIAFKASLFFMVFPTSFFMSLVYSEALFIFLVLFLFYFLHKKNYLIAAFSVFFLIFTRPVGILTIIPLLLFYLFDKKKKKTVLRLPSFADPVDLTFYPQALVFLIPLLGVFFYFLFMQMTTGNYFSGFQDQSSVISSWRLENAINPIFFLKNLFSPHLQPHSYLDSFLDRMFFVIFLISLPFIYRFFNKTIFIYSILLGFIPLFGSFMSYMRYLLPVFPLFILMGVLTNSKKYSLLFFPLLFLCYSLQIVFIILYGLNYWVS
ncbi:MAG: glycosyltransferase family 39 protein [Candidatus Levybacteria bacterium]|nr:glycosyltransferase family 39 protein [Candidatus Levybacteria bacterium]